jgi:hypothetical protein
MFIRAVQIIPNRTALLFFSLELWTARNCLERKRKSHENDNQKVNEEKIKNLLNEEFL